MIEILFVKKYRFWFIDFLLIHAQVFIFVAGLAPLLISAHEFVLSCGSMDFYILKIMADIFELPAILIPFVGIVVSALVSVSMSK